MVLVGHDYLFKGKTKIQAKPKFFMQRLNFLYAKF